MTDTNPTLTLYQRELWVEGVMNQTVRSLCFLGRVEPCWYLVGESVIIEREGDGRSPVEPTVPGD